MKPASFAESSPVRTVLACVALSDRGIAVAAETYRIARTHGATPLYLHVDEDTEETRAALTLLLREACGTEMHPRMLIRPGKVDDIVCAVAEEYNVDLIVTGALQREGMIGYYVGSAARKIARKAQKSVVLITAPSAAPRQLRTVAVRMDLDNASKATLVFAAAFVQPFGAETLHVLYEFELPALRAGLEDASDIREEELVHAQLVAEEEARLRAFIDDVDFRGLNVRIECLHGRRGVEARDYTIVNGIDLLITAAPKRRFGIFDKLFQHDVEYALESLPCDFLMFRGDALGEQQQEPT